MARLFRRRVLATVGITVSSGLAGCAEDGERSSPTNERAERTTGEQAETTTDGRRTSASPTDEQQTSVSATNEQHTPASPTDGQHALASPTADGGLDLREANVTAVSVEPSGDGYRFDVTLYHDDDGEDGYADWWQVETPDGEQLGRRTLLHAHGTREFTRSDTISVPDDVPCVIVRGHDQTHEYGGQAMVVTVETGATRALVQGSDRQSFADIECP